MTVINQSTCTLFTDAERFTQLAGYYEAERRTVWMMLRAEPRPCFNHEQLKHVLTNDFLLFQTGVLFTQTVETLNIAMLIEDNNDGVGF